MKNFHFDPLSKMEEKNVYPYCSASRIIKDTEQNEMIKTAKKAKSYGMEEVIRLKKRLPDWSEYFLFV